MISVALAASPLVVVGVLMIARNWPSVRAMPAGWLVAALAGTFAWKMSPTLLGAAAIAGLINTLDILLIVFGAVLILQLLQRSGGLVAIGDTLARLSPDRRVQALLVGWLLVSFLEGAAGFGTPAAVAAPLLVGIGFPPLAAVILALMGDSAAVTFGAIGVPIWGGFANLEGLLAEGTDFREVLHQIGVFAGLLHLFVGTFIPLTMAAFLTRLTTGSFRPGLAIWPLALIAGLSHTLTQALVAWLFGPELPAVLGSLVGIAVFLLILRKGWLQPKKPWSLPPREAWPRAWTGEAKAELGKAPVAKVLSPIRAWLPYIAVSVLLLFGRLEKLGLSPYLKAWSPAWRNILGTEISRGITPLYNPGLFPFLFVALLIPWLHGLGRRETRAAFGDTLRMIRPAAIALFFTLAMVYTMVHSGARDDQSSMLMVLAKAAASGLGDVWHLAAAQVGLLGAFISGSNTVSNIMFGAFQLETATQVGLAIEPVLALQAVGGAAGNMICVHNVVAALTTVGLIGKEGLVIRKNLPVALLYGLLAGLCGWLLA